MNKSFWMMTALAAFVAAPNLSGQENARIEIIDQDGEKVATAQIQIDDQDEDSSLSVGRQLRIEGDKIIITDANGETREIDISGARSVSVQQAVRSVDEDGQHKTETHGKAIIIGPDGERQVIELGAPLEGEENNGFRMLFGADLPDGLIVGEEPMTFRLLRNQLQGQQSGQAISKYMIGVNCEPVSDQLRSHLDLESEVGLIVQSVTEGSPAEKAGIQVHDILMSADGSELTSLATLSKIVERSGKEENPFTMTSIRGGAEIDLELSPIERPAEFKRNNAFLLDHPEMKMQFRQLGPGIIVGDAEFELSDETQSKIDEIRDRMNQLELELKIHGKDQLRNRKSGSDDDHDEDN